MSWGAFDMIIFDVVEVSSLGPLQANFHLQFTGVGWTKTCETFLKNRIKSENYSLLGKLVCNIMWTISCTKTCLLLCKYLICFPEAKIAFLQLQRIEFKRKEKMGSEKKARFTLWDWDLVFRMIKFLWNPCKSWIRIMVVFLVQFIQVGKFD